MTHNSYIKGLLSGIGSLLTGLKVTGREFFTPKVTEQYPENRSTLKMFDRYRGELVMNDTFHHRDGHRPRNGKTQTPSGTLRVRPRLVHVLPAVRERLPA